MSEGAAGGGIFGILCTTGLQTFCNTNHAGSGSKSRQAGCCPSNFCGAGEDDAFDQAEAKDKARKERLAAAAAQTTQPKMTPAMSRTSDATTAVDGASTPNHKTGDFTPPKPGLGPVSEGGPAGAAVAGGGLASSPNVQGLPKSDAGEGITRAELQARKDAAIE